MPEPTWPDWGASPPPHPHYEKRYFRGPQGDMHAGEVLDTVWGADVERHGEQREYQILRCSPCVGIHAWPLPEAEALARFYAEQFYQEAKPLMVQQYTEDALWWRDCVYTPIFDRCESLLPSECTRVQPRFLDIGAGVGLALDTANEHYGWYACGIEPNPERCQALRARAHTMLEGTLADNLEALHIYRPHCAMLYETLEHSPEPESMLVQVHDVMADDGLLICVVPQDYNALQMQACAALGLPRWWLAPPMHLHYFLPCMLKLLLRRCGFQPLYSRSTFPLEKFLLAGWDYITDPSRGRLMHHWRCQDEMHAVQHGQWGDREQEYQRNLEQQIGREMVFICRRRA